MAQFRTTPYNGIVLKLRNLCNLQFVTLAKLVKLHFEAFHFKVAAKFINTIVKFGDEIVDVLTCLSLGQQREKST